MSWSARLYADQDSILLSYLDEAQSVLDDLLSGFDGSRAATAEMNGRAPAPLTLASAAAAAAAAAEATSIASATHQNAPNQMGAPEAASVAVASESSDASGGSNAALSGGRRVKLPMRATLLLQEFFQRNMSHPYPTEDEKKKVRT